MTGMSAEEAAVQKTVELERVVLDWLKRYEVEPYYDGLIYSLMRLIENREDAARADERVKRKTFKDLKDWNQTAISWYEAGRNEALTECGLDDAAYAANCHNEVMADAFRSSSHHHLRKVKLSEAQPVEFSISTEQFKKEYEGEFIPKPPEPSEGEG